jgi:hypothetical protein
MTFGGNRDIGALAETNRLHLAYWTTTESAVEQDGAALDTHPQLGAEWNVQAKRSGEIVIDVNATLTVAETLDLSVQLQDAADDGAGSPDTWADVAAGVLLDTAHGGTGDLTAYALPQILQAAPSQKFSLGPIDLTRLRRHVRLQVTPTFSNVADVASVSVHVITGGAAIRPIDASAA